MSTSTAKGPSPWRSLFTTHLAQTTNREFALSTATLGPDNRPIPHVRICGFRGFFPELSLAAPAVEALQQRGIGLSPDVYESDMLSFTTDARMEKVRDIEVAGGAAEAVFWVKEIMTQWRIGGRAVIVGDPNGKEEEDRARRDVLEGLRVKPKAQQAHGQGGGEDWSWERMVTTYFANHTPVMRGFFKAPPPGQAKTDLPEDSPVKPGEKLHDLDDPVARRNFRVVVIKPEVVERLDLTDYENTKRWRWVIDGGGRWVEQELWP